jgi:hypothetical protein
LPRNDKKDARTLHTTNGMTESAEVVGHPDAPNKASVLSEKKFTSPSGKSYRITTTDESDPYDAHTSPKKRPRQREDTS